MIERWKKQKKKTFSLPPQMTSQRRVFFRFGGRFQSPLRSLLSCLRFSGSYRSSESSASKNGRAIVNGSCDDRSGWCIHVAIASVGLHSNSDFFVAHNGNKLVLRDIFPLSFVGNRGTIRKFRAISLSNVPTRIVLFPEEIQRRYDGNCTSR